MTRVAITGMGVVSAIGNDVETFRRALHTHAGGLAAPEGMDEVPKGISVVGQVRAFDGLARFGKDRLALLDPFAQYGLAAADEAIAMAGLDFRADPAMAARTACIVGTGGAGISTFQEGFARLYKEGKNRVNPFTVPRAMGNAACSQITMAHGITGPAFAVTSACATANHAIGLGFHMVRSGMVDRAVVGGSDALVNFGNLKAWEALRVVSRDTCRPFSKDRTGMVIGEGAGVFVLERWDDAVARGVPIQAEMIGFGMSADAGDITFPSVEGAARAVQACLDDAGLAPGDVDHINAHGTATTANDATEAKVIRTVFGDRTDAVSVTSTKSFHGHALGAAGGLELVAAVVALQDAYVPPTLNLTELDPACPLDVVTGTGREGAVRVALSNSFAFGGLNAVLAVRRTDAA
ncbi:beta-ketoacyl-[acyl-carrier-protein] synthase family protein [Roseospira marina]|uniref:Nodulation protein E n=1 Tax=Roseospira marina TaxID=140057 RepID=A0A5M6I8X6_9PROT|nr:beta-ketoacyl-[acyl-carrier-protein] synthase family protein [Roseospira marina]KAA5604714.1 beta-ketoacyl-[acyl-carrier-protein] synthase family protein [Roseospira marina]MBB4315162.1 nodulation protein E [Roseospira marina]MBB5088068.1 nodulation protein E [Roseospira marina]